ncbi:hypothetical protein M2323_004005 [Rhodoblastus acidophilus]|uniref:hypothetical protein n=1 Tax=Rhodoblastus acidophilus TaxID=1074 RepID=UPI00222482B0|nr:hypothetical protein [Rhodoblastus acidophilus]MCW2286167.1 hypothetical protein [Rhodoblastus acidophilus]MCW2335061.1 hypothetical protein [Rhodoblastus acidophilus]
MPRTSELAEIASVKLLIAKEDVIALGDPEAILWALDEFHRAEALLNRLLWESWPSPKPGALEVTNRVRRDFRA